MPNLYKRGETWWARFKVSGVEYRRSLRTASKSEAERRLKAVRSEVEGEARFGIVAPRSWQDAVIAWNRDATADLNPKTVKRYLTSFKQVHPFLADMEVHRIDVPKLKEMVKARRIRGAGTATIRRDLTAISAVLKHAADEGWREDVNPTLALRARGKMKERRDAIVLPNLEDIERLKAGCQSRIADAIDFARETGMRLEEIFGLTHRQLDHSTVTVERAKHRGFRVIPLSRKAKRIIEKQPQFIGSSYVFHQGDGKRWASPSSSFGNAQRRVVKAAQKAAQEYRWFAFHHLRHLFAVEYLKARRGTLYDLQQILGHSSVTTTEGYLKYLTPDEAKFALHGRAQKRAQV
jgi:integrase/recombinase XerD